MIREAIKSRLKDLGVTQKTISEFLGEHEQNLSSFLQGSRPYPYSKLIVLFCALGVTIGEGGEVVGQTHPDGVRGVLIAKIGQLGMTIKDLSEKTGVNVAVISCYLNGKRNISVNSLDKILNALGLDIVSHGEPQIMLVA